jgi:GTPase SAR1 family protein
MKKSNLLIVGLVNSGKTTIAKALCRKGFCEHFSIDSFREKYSNGSYAGEYRAWHRFLRIAENPPFQKNIFEFSGIGPNKEAFMQTMKISRQYWRTVYCISSKETLDGRKDIFEKKLSSVKTPYGKSHLRDITLEEVVSLYESNYYQTPRKLIETDSQSMDCTIKKILEFVGENKG